MKALCTLTLTVLLMLTAAQSASAQTQQTGTLEFDSQLEDSWLLVDVIDVNVEGGYHPIGEVPPLGHAEQVLPPSSTYEVFVRTELGSEHPAGHSGYFDVFPGRTTYVTAYRSQYDGTIEFRVEVSMTPTPTVTDRPSPRPRPTEVRTPNRIETGAGGTQDPAGYPPAPVLVLAGAVAALGLTAVTARRPVR